MVAGFTPIKDATPEQLKRAREGTLTKVDKSSEVKRDPETIAGSRSSKSTRGVTRDGKSSSSKRSFRPGDRPSREELREVQRKPKEEDTRRLDERIVGDVVNPALEKGISVLTGAKIIKDEEGRVDAFSSLTNRQTLGLFQFLIVSPRVPL